MREDLKNKLVSATIDITTSCNLSCKHCRLERLTYDMCLDEIETVCKKLHEYSTRMIFVSGGEPLIRKDIVEVVRLIKKYIPIITINTNGLLLNRELLEELIDAGVNYFQVSLDGLEEEHEKIRGEGTFKKTIENMKLICEYKDKVRLHVSSVVSKLNINKMDIFVDYLENKMQLPIQIIGFKRYVPKNIMAGKYNLGKDGLKQMWENVQQITTKYRGKVEIVCDFPIKNVFNKEKAEFVMKKYNLECAGCSAATSGPAIRSDGSVSPCSLLDVSYGNLVENSIEQIYESDIFENLIKRKLTGKCGECLYCQICGGCRAAAYLINGDYLSEDPECYI